MSTITEFVITSDASGQLWNSCVWDPHTGTSIMIYKGGGASAPRSLCALGNDYILSAESVKPVLHVWPVNSQETVSQGHRTVCPGRVSALAASPDACYCIAGIDEKLHVWQISSGRLLAVAARHFQKVMCVKFTDDSSHFVSGGEDGMVMVWSLSNLVCTTMGDAGDPRFIFSDHSLPVQDLAVGHGGLRAQLVSVSSDRTCKVYDLASGSLLLSVIFGVSLTAVAMDSTDSNVFVGGVDGNIHQFSLRKPPRMREYHMDSADEKSLSFVGHTKAVTCLSVSKDGVTLLSGSNDERVLLWHIPSRQHTRVLPHKGPITNAFFYFASKQMFANDLKPTVLLHSFQRGMDQDGVSNIIDVFTTQNQFPQEHKHQDNLWSKIFYRYTQDAEIGGVDGLSDNNQASISSNQTELATKSIGIKNDTSILKYFPAFGKADKDPVNKKISKNKANKKKKKNTNKMNKKAMKGKKKA